MKHHSMAEEESTELAALYAIGALGEPEAHAFEGHLAEGCDACAEELREFQAVAEQLAWASARQSPPREVHEKLLARIALEPRTPSAPEAPAASSDSETGNGAGSGESQTAPLAPSSMPQLVPFPEGQRLIVVRADQGAWRPTLDPGVFIKVLYVDEAQKMATSLLRMEPGSRIPMHPQNGTEQCLVLEGDLRAGDITLRAGDFHCALPDTHHGELTTVQGNLLLVFAPEDHILIQPQSR